MQILDQPLGLAGERKACALVCLSFYTALFGVLALLLANAPPDQPEIRAWWACFAALAACYGVSFFALGAGWFWARWFAIGLGYSGATLAFWSVVTQRTIDPIMAFYGLTHGLIALFLQGQKLAEEFDAKPEWRKLVGIDESGIIKVRHSVTRAAASLPTLIVIALAPREGAEGLWIAALGIAGLVGLLSLRTAGVVALFAAGLLLPLPLLSHSHAALSQPLFLSANAIHLMGLTAAGLLMSASLPFLVPMVQFLKRRVD
jgi:hypothetical protein